MAWTLEQPCIDLTKIGEMMPKERASPFVITAVPPRLGSGRSGGRLRPWIGFGDDALTYRLIQPNVMGGTVLEWEVITLDFLSAEKREMWIINAGHRRAKISTRVVRTHFRSSCTDSQLCFWPMGVGPDVLDVEEEGKKERLRKHEYSTSTGEFIAVENAPEGGNDRRSRRITQYLTEQAKSATAGTQNATRRE
ncbi:hypothetical protein FRB93_007501 [Tulasnella sp. JGI-2019a]|nr:hypothetical protein FRB93_007501 [Tulasnella sp. JGI-2019a]